MGEGLSCYVSMTSGGVGSWFATRRLLEKVPAEQVWCHFSDTLIEDEDCYRFLIESTAQLFDRLEDVKELADRCSSIPRLDRMAERKAYLEKLSIDAMEVIPRFAWLSDGRNPWEVFRDRRYLGNSRMAHCSFHLKQDVARRFLNECFSPADTAVVLGLDWSESHRLTGKEGRQHGAIEKWKPYRVVAPLCEVPYYHKHEMLTELDRVGVERPRLYGMGFPHNNCGGFCVKGGKGNFQLLLDNFPERFRWHEQQEQELREYLEADVTILREQRDGEKHRIPLKLFRERQGNCDMQEWGGCGCFSD